MDDFLSELKSIARMNFYHVENHISKFRKSVVVKIINQIKSCDIVHSKQFRNNSSIQRTRKIHTNTMDFNDFNNLKKLIRKNILLKPCSGEVRLNYRRNATDTSPHALSNRIVLI